MNRWHVASDHTVTAPRGRQWAAPSRRTAMNFAHTMAGIDHMLERIHQPNARPHLRAVPAPPPPPRRRHYGFGPAVSTR